MKQVMIVVTVAMVLAAGTVWAAEMPTEPRGGQPPQGSKPSVEGFADQVTYQRAFEAVVWSMPAMIKHGAPYVTATTDLRKGSVVLEVPKATENANLFGQIADKWTATYWKQAKPTV